MDVALSSGLSLFLMYLSEKYFITSELNALKMKSIVVRFIGGILLYFILFFCSKAFFSFISPKIRNFIYNIRIHPPDVSAQKNMELIDDFDNVAFDNLIVAYEMLNEIESSDELEIRTYCFHESIYYLKTAIWKVKEVTHPDRREQCLNIFGNTGGIDVFRLYNIYDIISDIYTKICKILSENVDNNTIKLYDDELEKSLHFQVEKIGDDIAHIKSCCANAKNDMRIRW